MRHLYKNLSQPAKVGILLSLLGAVGWGLCIAAILFFEYVFQQKTEISLFRFVVVPSLIMMIGVIVNVFEIHKKIGIRPSQSTLILTIVHGFWGLYVGLQAHPSYNGFIILFLYSIGLQYMKTSAGFNYTIIFSLVNLIAASVMIQALRIEIGIDEKLFLFFFAFNGFSASFMNHFSRKTQNNLKREQKQRLHSFKQLQKMFYPHQLQLIAEGKELEQTMPVGEGRATVLAFDIIGSSLVEHEDSARIFHETFGMCSELMMRSYDHATQEAEAYLINETGDGFICSVGYPFKTPQNQTQAVVAYKLALEFIAVFESNVINLDYPDPVHTSIAIATGDVHCFYSKHMPMDYHAYGKGVVLATRYEQVRRQISKVIPIEGSIVILQSAVYKSLPQNLRENFTEFRLEESVVRVRDDAAARSLYYQIIPSRQASRKRSA